MRTVGVDLAAEPRRTAVASIAWHDGIAQVERLVVGQTDEQIVATLVGADKAGIDCPLGWPEPFVEFLNANRAGRPIPPTDLAARRRLAYRTTDLAVVAEFGIRPLSVSADLIGHAAMRAAGLLSTLANAGCPVDRAGSGLVVESYPAAALRQWELYRPRYKGAGRTAIRDLLIHDQLAAAPALRLGPADAALCSRSDDALDAILCAFIARAAALGRVTTPGPEQAAAAATEGWIAVPTCPLGDLFG